MTSRWLLAAGAIIFSLALIHAAVLLPLSTGTAIQPDQAVFTITVLLAACTIAYFCRYQTTAAKWAMFFMLLLSIWAHALAYMSEWAQAPLFLLFLVCDGKVHIEDIGKESFCLSATQQSILISANFLTGPNQHNQKLKNPLLVKVGKREPALFDIEPKHPQPQRKVNDQVLQAPVPQRHHTDKRSFHGTV